jgi:hypothetical protein
MLGGGEINFTYDLTVAYMADVLYQSEKGVVDAFQRKREFLRVNRIR